MGSCTAHGFLWAAAGSCPSGVNPHSGLPIGHQRRRKKASPACVLHVVCLDGRILHAEARHALFALSCSSEHHELAGVNSHVGTLQHGHDVGLLS